MTFGALAAPAGAAVMLYRLVSFWGVVGVGWLAWLVVRAAESREERGLTAPAVETPQL